MAAVVPVVPTVEPDVDPLPIVAFARTKPDFGAVPAGAADASSRQPVTVTVLSSVLLLVAPLGVCAATPIAVAHANAVAIHVARFIDNLLGAKALQSEYPFNRARVFCSAEDLRPETAHMRMRTARLIDEQRRVTRIAE